jgi:hypothetical protein
MTEDISRVGCINMWCALHKYEHEVVKYADALRTSEYILRDNLGYFS